MTRTIHMLTALGVLLTGWAVAQSDGYLSPDQFAAGIALQTDAMMSDCPAPVVSSATENNEEVSCLYSDSSVELTHNRVERYFAAYLDGKPIEPWTHEGSVYTRMYMRDNGQIFAVMIRELDSNEQMAMVVTSPDWMIRLERALRRLTQAHLDATEDLEPVERP